jgi:hypothetical protein
MGVVEGVIWIGSVGDHILQDFYTLYISRFIIYKITGPPQKRQNLGVEGV